MPIDFRPEKSSGINFRPEGNDALDASSVPRGGVGYEVDPAAAREEAFRRVYARNVEAGKRDLLFSPNESKFFKGTGSNLRQVGTGIIPKAMIAVGDFGSGIGLGIPGAVFGLAEDAATKLAKMGIINPENLKAASIRNARAENEDVSIPANFFGGLMPAKAVASGTKVVGQEGAGLIKKLYKAGKGGIAIGSTVGANSAIQDVGLEPEAIAERSLVGGGIGLGAGLLLQGVGSAAAGISRLRKSPGGIFASLTDFNPSQRKETKRLNSGKYDEMLPEIKPFKTEEGTRGALNAMDKLIARDFEAINPIVRQADSSLIAPDLIEKELRSSLRGELPTKVINNEVSKLKDLIINDTIPENLLDQQRYLNRRSSSFYNRRDPELSEDSVKAIEALRDIYSTKIKGILKDGGFDPKRYSRYGRISDMRDQLDFRYEEASKLAKEARGTGPIERMDKGIDSGNMLSGAIRGSKAIFKPAFQNEQERFDELIEEMFSKVKVKPSKIQPIPLEVKSLKQESLSAKKAALAEEALKRNVRVFEKLKKIQEERAKQGQ